MSNVQTIDNDLITTTPEIEQPSQIEREDIISLSMKAEGRIDAIKRMITTAIRMTNPFDWVKQGYGDKSKPYLCASGAEKIASLFHVKIYNVKAEKFTGHDDKGDYYFYVYTCQASLSSGHIIETEGTCSSRDQFFAYKGGELKPASEVDETNIRKAAHSNMTVRAITQLLGLRNLPWEMLKAAGLDIARIAGVEYKDTKAETSQKNGSPDAVISEAQGKRLYAIFKGAGGEDEDLKDYLLKTYNISTSKQILKKDYEAICKWAEKGGKV